MSLMVGGTTGVAGELMVGGTTGVAGKLTGVTHGRWYDWCSWGTHGRWYDWCSWEIDWCHSWSVL